jgi:hypothetical protein
MSGETCAPSPPRSECAVALYELALLHFSALNEAYHKGILRSWEDGGCLAEINSRLGYRLALTAAEFNEQVRPGGVLNLRVSLQNSGFAAVVNPRPLYVVLIPEAPGDALRVRLEIDPRTWEPGTAVFSAALRVPDNAAEGVYRLALWLPDGYESLMKDPRYAIRFANENVWDEAGGANVLGTVRVDRQAGGAVLGGAGDGLQVVESSSSVERSLVPAAPEPGPGPDELIRNPAIESQAGALVIRFEFLEQTADYNGFQAFLDADQDAATGFTIGGIGADFLLENEGFNSYAGTGGDWTWAPVEAGLVYSNADGVAAWRLPAGALGEAARVDAVFQLADTNWDSAYVTRRASFELK